jgi:hypothetical protein
MVIQLCHEYANCPFKIKAGCGEAVVILRIVIGALVGAVLGFGWYKLVGCSTGACPLTSNPFTSTLFGMVMGALAAGSFR